MSVLKHRGKEKIKVGFSITFLNIKKVDKSLNGSTVFLDWKRSSKPGCSGFTKRALVSNTEANWPQEPITFTSTFFKEPRGDKFDKKVLQVVLMEDVMKNKKQKPKSIIKTNIDLSQFVKKHEFSETLTVSFKKDKDSPVLKFSLKAHWMKLNNKLLIRADDPQAAQKGKSDQVVDIEGTEYILRTDSNASESTVDTMSVISDLEKDDMDGALESVTNDLEDQDYKGGMSQEEAENWKQRIDEIEAESLDRLKTIQTLQKELDHLRKQSEKLKQENTERLKKLTTAEQEKEDLFNQLETYRKGNTGEASTKNQDRLNDRMKKLKAANDEKDRNLALMEEEVERLKRQLDTFQNGDENSAKKKLAEVRAQVEEMQTVIDKQEHEIKRLKRKKDKSGDEPSSPTPTHRDQGGNNSPRSSDSNDAESKINADELSLIEKHVYTVEPFFTNNTSNAASALFRTLLSWKAFQSPRSKFLPRLAESIEVAIKRCRYDTEMLCYWISTTTSFLYKFAKEKANFNGSAKGGSYDQAAITKFDVNVVAAVNLSYSLLIKNMYRDLDAWIIHSILEQKPSDRVLTEIFLQRKLSRVHGVIGILANTLEALTRNYVADAVISQVFVQVFFYMDAVLFNALVDRKDCCTCTNGFQIKLELSEIIEGWVLQKSAFLHRAKDELNFITQAATILVMDKSNLGDKQVLDQICPSLNYYQVKHVLEHYKPDTLSPEPVPTSVIHQLGDLCSRQRLNRDSLKIDVDFMYPLSLSSFIGK